MRIWLEVIDLLSPIAVTFRKRGVINIQKLLETVVMFNLEAEIVE